MARPLRLEFAGALYHITSRGDRREAIYRSDDDREAWLYEGQVLQCHNVGHYIPSMGGLRYLEYSGGCSVLFCGKYYEGII